MEHQDKRTAFFGKYMAVNGERLCVMAAFLFFLLFSCYRLTAAPLWYDETIEFYFSRYLTGPIENVTGLNNLYERLIYYSFQPPLYNLVMAVWLLPGESEWWYRFSGVIFGCISAAGLYKAAAYQMNRKTGALTVALYPLLYEIMYYFRECAEYALMLMFMTWTVYFYFRALKEKGYRNVILFTICCVLDLYSQYGSAFLVAPLAVSLLVEKWRKSREEIKGLLCAYIAAALGAGIPLYWFFLRVQISVQATGNDLPVEFYHKNVFYDFFKNLSYLFSWNLIDNFSIERFEWLTVLLLAIMSILAAAVLLWGENGGAKHLIVVNAVSWLLYYVVVKLRIYAYGWFGNRYNIFFVPVWFLCMVMVVYECVEIIRKRCKKKWPEYALIAVMACFALFIVALNLRKMEHVTWKGHTREVVDLWYQLEGYEVFTYVCFGENVNFEYYLTHNDSYREEYKDHIYMETGDEISDTEEKTPQEYIEIIRAECGGVMPEEIYVSTGNRFVIADALEMYGYTSEIVYQTNATLYYFHQ